MRPPNTVSFHEVFLLTATILLGLLCGGNTSAIKPNSKEAVILIISRRIGEKLLIADEIVVEVAPRRVHDVGGCTRLEPVGLRPLMFVGPMNCHAWSAWGELSAIA